MRTTRIAILVLTILLGFGAACVTDSEKAHLNDSVDESFELVTNETAQESHRIFPDTEEGRRLEEHLKVVATPAATLEQADQLFIASLKRLKINADQNSAMLADTYHSTDESRYFVRWSLIKTLGDLEQLSAITLLKEISFAPLPEEKSDAPHSLSTVALEISIRLRAIGGLGQIAGAGNAEAQSALFDLATQDTLNPTIRRRAVKNYLLFNDEHDGRAKKLRAALPEHLHELVSSRVTSHTDFQIRSRKLLKLEGGIKSDDGDRTEGREAPTVSDKE